MADHMADSFFSTPGYGDFLIRFHKLKWKGRMFLSGHPAFSAAVD